MFFHPTLSAVVVGMLSLATTACFAAPVPSKDKPLICTVYSDSDSQGIYDDSDPVDLRDDIAGNISSYILQRYSCLFYSEYGGEGEVSYFVTKSDGIGEEVYLDDWENKPVRSVWCRSLYTGNRDDYE